MSSHDGHPVPTLGKICRVCERQFEPINKYYHTCPKCWSRKLPRTYTCTPGDWFDDGIFEL